MEKERAIQCVPLEMLERLKGLGERLWNDKNPASVQLNAILEEFEPDLKSLGHIITEYEADYAGRLAFNEREHAQKEGRLKEEAADCCRRLAEMEKEHAAGLKRIEELKAALNAREAALSDLKSKTVEDGSQLNSKYVDKMQELYDRVNRKELEMLNRWEEKNKGLETKVQSLESDFAAKAKQFKLREKALEEDLNGRKAELIKTFDRIRADLEARERAVAAHEKKMGNKAGGGV
jgi:chromosome segregation ATPase